MTNNDARSEIERLSVEWSAAFNRDDPARAVADFYSEDAVLLPPPGPPGFEAAAVEGRDAVAGFVQDYVDLFLEEKLPSEVREIHPLGDAVVELSTWRARHADRAREGHVMRLWRQEAGEEDYGEACLSAWGRGPVLGYAWLNLRTGYGRSWDGSLEEWTWVDYGRNAGDVTYHSFGHSRYFDEVTGEEFYYSWNYDDAMSEPGFLPYGENYTLEIRVTEGGSDYPILAVVPLESWTSEWEEPYTCFGWFDDWPGWTSTYCSEASSYEHGLSGWVSSFGF